MKKVSLLLLAALLLGRGSVALAAQTDVTAIYAAGTLFGEITNVGDQPVRIDSAVYDLYDDDGKAVSAGRFNAFYPPVIAPGEKAFFAISANAGAETGSHFVSVTGKPASGDDSRLLASCSYEETIAYVPSTCTNDDDYEPESIRTIELFAVLENDTDALAKEPKAVWAIYDTDGSLLYVHCETIRGVSLFPGSKIQVSTQVRTDILAILDAAGAEIGEVVAAAWH